MEEKLVETFMEARVAETGRDRAYWLSRSWVDQHRRGAVAAAPIVVLPWEDAEGDKIHYPTAAPEFVQMLREAFGPDLTIAIPTRPEDYAELVLHSREWRLPKLLIGFVLVPLLVNLLSDKVAELLPGFEVGDTIEIVNRRPKGTPYRRAKGTPFVEQRDGYDGRAVRAGCGVGRA